jgi:mRNA interferase YafQ
MKYSVHQTKRFKKSLKRVRQLRGFNAETLKKVIRLLSAGEPLPLKYRDHKLSGNLAEFRECHLAPDILLLYQIDNGLLLLTLVSVGNHA